MEIKLGDRVRSYDFEERKDCYIEGVVQGFKWIEGCERYEIKADKQVFKDEAHDIDKVYYPPVNGTPKSFGGVCDGVELVGG